MKTITSCLDDLMWRYCGVLDVFQVMMNHTVYVGVEGKLEDVLYM